MKTAITTREELLLAKIAGQDVSLSTMTPPAPMNLSEKLMLDIADKVGAMKPAENVAEAAGSAPTAAEFKALLDALIAAGIMKQAAASSGSGG